QRIKITGKVVEGGGGQPLGGVSIRSGGTIVGPTQSDGSFRTEIEAGATVAFQLIGYTSLSKTFSSASANERVILQEGTQNIDELVVTALGIQREKKALRYAATERKVDQLTEALPNNWSEALSGRVAGVN